MDLRRELARATELARQAGALVLSYFGHEIAVETKPGEGPVTRADREAGVLIVEGLRSSFPDDGILSEEAPDDGSRLRCRRAWMIDPLDGTRDFVAGRPGFSVMIGLVIDGRPTLGVVFQPVGGVLYDAFLGGGARKIDEDGRAQPLHVSGIHQTSELRLVTSRSHRTADIDRVRGALGVSDELRLGSVGLKLCTIAGGERDLYVNPEGHSSLWDSCGPEAILREAGGVLTDLSGRPLNYTGPSTRNSRGLVASNGLLHDHIIAQIARLGLAAEHA